MHRGLRKLARLVNLSSQRHCFFRWSLTVSGPCSAASGPSALQSLLVDAGTPISCLFRQKRLLIFCNRCFGWRVCNWFSRLLTVVPEAFSPRLTFPSFLSAEVSSSINCLLGFDPELLHVDSVEFVSFCRGVVLHPAELGIQLRGNVCCDFLSLQHGVVFALSPVAAPTVPRAGAAAEDGLRDLMLAMSSNISHFFPLLSSILCLCSCCHSRSLRARLLESVTGILDATQSVTEQVEEDDIELIPESPCIDAKLCEVMSSSCSLGS